MVVLRTETGRHGERAEAPSTAPSTHGSPDWPGWQETTSILLLVETTGCESGLHAWRRGAKGPYHPGAQWHSLAMSA